MINRILKVILMTKSKKEEVRLPTHNELFSIPNRFNIMLILFINERISFSKLQKLVKLTPGNLKHHLDKLDENKYITIRKMILSSRPTSIIHITEQGKNDFSEYLNSLKTIVLITMKNNS